MNGRYHCPPILGQVPQRLHHKVSCSTVKASGGFVQEEQGRSSDDLQRNAETALFTSTEPAHEKAPHACVLALRQPHLLNGCVYYLDLLVLSGLIWQPQGGGVHDALTHR
ncbi:hypothetical protein M758_5G107800 [Ceratodon purpureus]|nr:hypothetical protein M758_5G107800 [Ceratodon purpureus]